MNNPESNDPSPEHPNRRNSEHKPDHNNLFTPRNVIFALMAIIAAGFILLRPPSETKKPRSKKGPEKQWQAMDAVFLYQSVFMANMPQPARGQAFKDLKKNINKIEADTPIYRGKRVVRKYMIYDYWGEFKPEDMLRPAKETRDNRLYRDFTRLYIKKHEIKKEIKFE